MSWAGLALVTLAGCGGPAGPGQEDLPPLRARPDCWVPEPVGRDARRLFAELRFGAGLDALERMLAPLRRAPGRPRWRVATVSGGVEVVRTGRAEAGGWRAALEVFDLEADAVRPVEAWRGRAWVAADGWRFHLAGRAGWSGPRYVRWGDARRGCGRGLAFRASGADVSCWSARGPEPEAACQALEARLLAGAGAL